MSNCMLKFIAAITTVISLTACTANNKSEQTDIPDIADSKTTDTAAPISVETIPIINSKASNDRGVYCSVDYCDLNIGEAFKAAYPELEKALESFNTDFKRRSDSELEELVNDTESFSNDEGYIRFEKTYSSKICRADSNVVSVANEVTEYAKEDLGLTGIYGVSFDSQSGKQLSIDDVVSSRSKLAEAVKAQAEKFNINLPVKDGSLESFLGSEKVSWTIGYSGITVFFNPSNKNGNVELITVDFADNKEIFNEKYTDTPKAYFAPLPAEYPYYYDFDGDGKLDKFELTAEKSDYDSYAYVAQTITINNASLNESDIYCYDFEPLLLHTENGKNYIYLQRTYDNDYHEITIYDVNENSIKQLDTISSGFHYNMENVENYEIAQALPYDPGSFTLDTRTDVLSTLTGTAEYFADNRGIPSPKKDWYLFDSNNQLTFTLLEDVKAQRLDDGTENGGITMKKGTKVVYTGTDNKSTAYLALDDGTLVSVKVDMSDWPKTIDGVDIQKLFDGIMFAG